MARTWLTCGIKAVRTGRVWEICDDIIECALVLVVYVVTHLFIFSH